MGGLFVAAALRLWASRAARLWLFLSLLTASTAAAVVPVVSGAALRSTLESALRPWSPPFPGVAWLRFAVPSRGQGAGAAAALSVLSATASRAPLTGLGGGPVLRAALLPPRDAVLQSPFGSGTAVLRLAGLPGPFPGVRWVQGRAPLPASSGSNRPAPIEGAVSEATALATGLSPGDTVTYPTGGAAPPVEIRIVGIYGGSDAGAWSFPHAQSAVAVPLRALLAPHAAAAGLTLFAGVPLQWDRLSPAMADRAYRGLRQWNADAEAALPGASLAASPMHALAAYRTQRALLVRTMAAGALPVAVGALALAALAGVLCAERDREEVDTWLVRGARPGRVLALYAAEWSVVGAVAVLLASPFAVALALSGALGRWPPSWTLSPAASWLLWPSAVVAAGALAALVPVVVQLLSHDRRPDTAGRHRNPWALHLGVDGVLVAGGIYASVAMARRVAAAAAHARFGLQPWDPLSLQPPGLFVLPAALLAGGALATTRLVTWAAAAARERLARAGGLSAFLLARGAGRLPAAAAAAAALVAFAVGSGVVAWSTASSFAAVQRAEALYRVGAPIRIVERIPAPCDEMLPGGGCLRGGREVPTPTGGIQLASLDWPVPPDPATNIPGVAAATRVFTTLLAPWMPGSETVRYVQVDPATFGRAAVWPAGLAPHRVGWYLARLRANGTSAVLVAGGAAVTAGAAGGDYFAAFPCLVFLPGCPPRIVGTPGPWPWLPSAGPPVVVGAYGGPTPDLAPLGMSYIGGRFAWGAAVPAGWPLAPISADELLRLRPGASLANVVRALARHGVQVLSTLTPAQVLAAARTRPESAARAMLLRLGLWLAAVSAVVTVLMWSALAAVRTVDQRRLLVAVGVPRRAVRWGTALEHGAVAGAGLALGLALGGAVARLCVPWLLSFVARLPDVPFTVVVPHPWWSLWTACAAALLWAAAAAVAGGARDPADREAPRARLREAIASARAVVALRLAVVAAAAARLESAGRALAAAARAGLHRESAGRGQTAALGVALALAALTAAAAPLSAESALGGVLREALAPQHGRPAGAVLLIEDPNSAGVIRPGLADLLGQTMQRLPVLTGRPASPTVTVLQSATLPLAPEPKTGPTPFTSSLVADLVAQAGVAAHVQVLQGRLPSAALLPGGIAEAAVTEAAKTSLDLSVGRLYDLQPGPGQGPAMLRVRVVGVFRRVQPAGAFWPFQASSGDLYVAPQVLSAWLRAYPRLQGLIAAYRVMDTAGMSPADAARVAGGLEAILASPGLGGQAMLSASPVGALSAYLARLRSLRTLLMLLLIPALCAALYLAVLAADATLRARRAEIATWLLRGAGRGLTVASFAAVWLPVAAAAAVAGAVVAPLVDRGVLAAGGAPVAAGWGWAAAWRYAALPPALGLLAALAAAWRATGQGVVAERHLAGRPSTPPLWRRAYLDALLFCPVAYELVVLRSRFAEAASSGAPPLTVFLLSPLLLIGLAGLTFRAAGYVAARLDRSPAPGRGLVAQLTIRRLAREPARWSAAWLLLAFCVGEAWAGAAGAAALRQNLDDGAGYAVGADMSLIEAWPSQCSETPPILPTPPGRPFAADQRFDCFVEGQQWGTKGVFGYQLPPPPPAPFSVNLTLPGVTAATSVLEDEGTVGPPGDRAVSAHLVGIDPATYRSAAWWRSDLNPLPLQAYLQGLSAGGGVYLDAVYMADNGLRAGEAVDLTVGGRSLPWRILGPVANWPGLTPQTGVLVVGPSRALVRDYSIKVVDYEAFLRTRPGTSANALGNLLQHHGLFVVTSGDRRQQAADSQLQPEQAAARGVLAMSFLALSAVALLGFLLLLGLAASRHVADIGLFKALGLESADLTAAFVAEQAAVLVLATCSGFGLGALGNRLFTPLLQGSGTVPLRFLTTGPGLGAAAIAVALLAGLAEAARRVPARISGIAVSEALKGEW